MKRFVVVFVLLLWAIVPDRSLAGDGTMFLNNYDSNNPIYYLDPNVRYPVEGTFVQVLAGPSASALAILSNSAGQSVFTLTEPGFFDAGFGIVPGVQVGALATFQIRVWRNAATFPEGSDRAISSTFTQSLGPSPFPFQGRMTNLTPFGYCPQYCLPEPSTLLLGIIGALVLFYRRLNAAGSSRKCGG